MTEMQKKKNKPGRNDLCPCRSGSAYKYCCIVNEPRPRVVALDQECTACGGQLQIDISNDIMAVLANLELPLKSFCKDNDFYWFAVTITMKQMLGLSEMLKNGQLTIKYLMDIYKSQLSKEIVFDLLGDAEGLNPALGVRIRTVRDAVEAHFEGRYSLSIPALLPQIEGFHRAYGNLSPKDNFIPTLPKDAWDLRFLPSMADSVRNFNAYLTKLFQGSQPSNSFNRNPILHGINAEYASEDWSLILILVFLEIRNFLWFEKHTQPFLNRLRPT